MAEIDTVQVPKVMFECQVCLERYREPRKDPRILPCGHTFCHICLLAMTEKGQIKCPLCKDLHHVPSHGFKKNYFLAEMLHCSEHDDHVGNTSECVRSHYEVDDKAHRLLCSSEKENVFPIGCSQQSARRRTNVVPTTNTRPEVTRRDEINDADQTANIQVNIGRTVLVILVLLWLLILWAPTGTPSTKL